MSWRRVGGRRAIAPLVLTLDNKWRPDLHTPAASLPGKNPTTHWIRPWVRPWSGLEVLERRKNNFPCQDSNLPARDLVSILTRLILLRWPRFSARIIQIICNITFPYTKTFSSVQYMTHAFNITSSYHLNKTVLMNRSYVAVPHCATEYQQNVRLCNKTRSNWPEVI